MSNYLEKPSKYPLFFFFEDSAKIFTIFGVVKGVYDENSDATMLPASVILENGCLSACSVAKLLLYSFQVGNN